MQGRDRRRMELPSSFILPQSPQGLWNDALLPQYNPPLRSPSGTMVMNRMPLSGGSSLISGLAHGAGVTQGVSLSPEGSSEDPDRPGLWTSEEESLLRELVQQHGTAKWAKIAKQMDGKNGKQCRERWQNHLRPNIKKEAWSEEEERVMVEAHKELGNRWAAISRMISGRTENGVKNHWNTTKRKLASKRRLDQRVGTHTLLEEYISSLQGQPSQHNPEDGPEQLPENSPPQGTAIGEAPQSAVSPLPPETPSPDDDASWILGGFDMALVDQLLGL